jgi:hypothetical protein
MNITYTDEQGVLNINYKGKVRVGDRDGSSTMLFIDSENGIVDIGGEGSDNFVRVEPGKITILTAGKVAVQGESMTQPCGAEPSDEDLNGSDIAFFADEATGRIRFKFKDSNGVVHVDDVGLRF